MVDLAGENHVFNTASKLLINTRENDAMDFDSIQYDQYTIMFV